MMANAPLTIRPDLASELKPKTPVCGLYITARIPTISRYDPVENELFVHTLFSKDLPEYLQALDQLARCRARTIKAHGADFGLRSREEGCSPAEGDIFQQGSLIGLFDVDVLAVIRPRANSRLPVSRRSFPSENVDG